jgi:hypothetical protein
MKITRDLAVFCELDSVDLIACQIEQQMGDDWHRSREDEARMRPLEPEGPIFAFVRQPKGGDATAVLVMTHHRRALRVNNIVPSGDRLSTGKYNSILTEFHLRFVHPVASSLGLHTELSRDELRADEVFGSKGMKLLKAFSLLANKSALHSFDEERWFRFLICLHQRPRHPYENAFLRTFLIGDGWPQERADELVSQCEFTRDLLQLYDCEYTGAVPAP